MSYFLDFGEFDLTNLVDLHLRSSGQADDDLDCIRAARIAGMRAVLLRPAAGLTTGHAEDPVHNRPGFVTAGAYRPGSLDGLAPEAVAAALAGGVKLVDFSACAVSPAPDDWERALGETFEQVRDAGAVLASGDLGGEEVIPLVRAAQNRGAAKILVPALHLHALAQAGLDQEGVFFEWTLAGLDYPADPHQVRALADSIQQAGVEARVIASGLRPGDRVQPVDGLSYYLAALAAQGLSVRDIKQAAGKTPGLLLDLPQREPHRR